MTDQNEVEVTQEMIEAGMRIYAGSPSTISHEDKLSAIYRAMHKARPKHLVEIDTRQWDDLKFGP